VIRLAVAGFIGLLFFAPLIGLFGQMWAPFWFGQQQMLPIAIGTPIVIGMPTPTPAPIPTVGAGMVSDSQRYQLARAAGWNPADAITATAISFAEDGSGNPAALSAPNWDGSRDLGLWQINSAWWPQFGGQAALVVPMNNARAGFAVFQRQGWCAWSTYEARCGPGHNSAYAAFLCRALLASGALRCN